MCRDFDSIDMERVGARRVLTCVASTSLTASVGILGQATGNLSSHIQGQGYYFGEIHM